MDKTSRNRDPEALELIASLTRHPAYKSLVSEVVEARERYFANFARGLAKSSNPVDQREVDEKRGFWKGAIWALNVYPNQISLEWDKFLAEIDKESETA